MKVAADDTGVVIGIPPDTVVVLQRKPAASGALYSEHAVSFWNKGDEAVFTYAGRTHTCRAVRR